MTPSAAPRGRGRVGSLRIRVVLALLAASLAALGAATLTVLPPLEHRLEADRLADLRRLAETARPALRAIPARDLRPGARPLLRIVDHLQRRTGGRIVVYDDGDRALADTAPLRDGPAVDGLDGQRQGALARRDRVVTGSGEERAFAVTVVRDGRDRLTLVLVKRLSDTRAAASVVRGALPPALAAGVLVALVLAILLSRWLLRRLRRLQDDAHALGTEGLEHVVAVDGDDEVTEVAQALEDMRARLVVDEAERQAFVATASHELRTPLASLQATLELLREEAAAKPTDAAVLVGRADTALRQTHRLVGLAADLLDLSRVDGGAPLSIEPLEVAETVGLVAREFGARLAADGRDLNLEGGPALALADPVALARIVRILLDNAGHYGAGAVTVAVAAGPSQVAVAVSDHGPGLGADERETVFLRFARGSASAGAPGAGLGLAIARGLARAMGGELAVADAPEGARFVLTLRPWHGDGAAPAPVAHQATTSP